MTAEIKAALDKKRSGATLSAAEQSTLDAYAKTLRAKDKLTTEEQNTLDELSSKEGKEKVTVVKESERAEGEGLREVRERDGVTTVVSSVSQEEADKAKKKEAAIPAAVNETQRLTGSPGNVNLTQGGVLNSDKSFRDTRDIKEVQKEQELKAAPNPIPNRDGNERLRAELGFSASNMIAIDQNTSAMAEEIKAISSKSSLNAEDKETLKRIETRLRETGRT